MEQRDQLGETMPHLAKVADDICVIKSMYGEAINHDPAATCFRPARSFGTTEHGPGSVGLGSDNSDLRLRCLDLQRHGKSGQPLYDRLWGSVFCGRFKGQVSRTGDPILDLDPAGVTRSQRRRMLDTLGKLNQAQADHYADPDIRTRIAQYELAYRMQTSVPGHRLFDRVSKRRRFLWSSPKVGKYAYNCLLARRLAEQGVPSSTFSSGLGCPGEPESTCVANARYRSADRRSSRRPQKGGMLEDTLVVWGGNSVARFIAKEIDETITGVIITRIASLTGWPVKREGGLQPRENR